MQELILPGKTGSVDDEPFTLEPVRLREEKNLDGVAERVDAKEEIEYKRGGGGGVSSRNFSNSPPPLAAEEYVSVESIKRDLGKTDFGYFFSSKLPSQGTTILSSKFSKEFFLKSLRINLSCSISVNATNAFAASD